MAADGNLKDSLALNLHAGELVAIRSKEEILATLDEKGRLDGLPFMPEMLKYCGQRVRVYKSAHKTCDTVDKTGGRRVPRSVHLEGLRCNGEAHGGCQAACLLFWKDAWVKKVPLKSNPVSFENNISRNNGKCSDEALWSNTTRRVKPHEQSSPDLPGMTYVCQTTEIPNFTAPLHWWDIRQYVKDLTSRNVTALQVIEATLFRIFRLVLRVGAYRAMTCTYDCFQRMRGGTPYPFREGRRTSRTPSEKLNLRPGEMVQIKSYEEILETIDKAGKNRGMRFDAEAVKYCGKTFRVLTRVERIIDEKTGTMRHLSNDCIVLENVICKGQMTALRVFCPTATYAYWREIWLKRVGGAPQASQERV